MRHARKRRQSLPSWTWGIVIAAPVSLLILWAVDTFVGI